MLVPDPNSGAERSSGVGAGPPLGAPCSQLSSGENGAPSACDILSLAVGEVAFGAPPRGYRPTAPVR